MQSVEKRQNFKEQWNSLMKCTNIKDKSDSYVFVKKYISVMISSFTYYRKIFPHDSYTSRRIEDFRLPVLTTGNNLEVNNFLFLIKECFDALKRGYLEELRFMICSNELKPQNLEEFIFKFKYDEKGKLTNWQTPFEIPLATQQEVLQSLHNSSTISKSLRPMPKSGLIYILLFFNERVTPPEYNPDGFEPCTLEGYPQMANKIKVDLGTLQTPFHHSRVFIKTTGISSTKIFQSPETSRANQLSGMNASEDNEEKHVEGQETSASANSVLGDSKAISVDKKKTPRVREPTQDENTSPSSIAEMKDCLNEAAKVDLSVTPKDVGVDSQKTPLARSCKAKMSYKEPWDIRTPKKRKKRPFLKQVISVDKKKTPRVRKPTQDENTPPTMVDEDRDTSAALFESQVQGTNSLLFQQSPEIKSLSSMLETSCQKSPVIDFSDVTPTSQVCQTPLDDSTNMAKTKKFFSTPIEERGIHRVKMEDRGATYLWGKYASN